VDIKELGEIVSQLRFRNWDWRIREQGDGWSLQTVFPASGRIQHGRKWHISRHTLENEVVQTALQAVLTALEQQALEDFRYIGRAVFHPHIDVRALLSVADEHHKALREESRVPSRPGEGE